MQCGLSTAQHALDPRSPGNVASLAPYINAYISPPSIRVDPVHRSRAHTQSPARSPVVGPSSAMQLQAWRGLSLQGAGARGSSSPAAVVRCRCSPLGFRPAIGVGIPRCCLPRAAVRGPPRGAVGRRCVIHAAAPWVQRRSAPPRRAALRVRSVASPEREKSVMSTNGATQLKFVDEEGTAIQVGQRAAVATGQAAAPSRPLTPRSLLTPAAPPAHACSHAASALHRRR
jgi:hypothetical protein